MMGEISFKKYDRERASKLQTNLPKEDLLHRSRGWDAFRPHWYHDVDGKSLLFLDLACDLQGQLNGY